MPIELHRRRKLRKKLDRTQSINLFRIFQEALTNASRRSFASKVEVEFHHSDNGRGMPDNYVATSNSYGMLGMTERVEQLGGKIKFISPPDGGSSVKLSLPLADNTKEKKV